MIFAERERERERFLLEDHSHRSARARCFLLKNILHISYSGAINQAGFHVLDDKLHHSRMLASVGYEHMDKALTLTGQVIVNESAWPPETPPSVVVVRPDQYDQAVTFSQLLAYRGITRFVFLPEEIRVAQAFVERVCERRSHRSH